MQVFKSNYIRIFERRLNVHLKRQPGNVIFHSACTDTVEAYLWRIIIRNIKCTFTSIGRDRRVPFSGFYRRRGERAASGRPRNVCFMEVSRLSRIMVMSQVGIYCLTRVRHGSTCSCSATLRCPTCSDSPRSWNFHRECVFQGKSLFWISLLQWLSKYRLPDMHKTIRHSGDLLFFRSDERCLNECFDIRFRREGMLGKGALSNLECRIRLKRTFTCCE